MSSTLKTNLIIHSFAIAHAITVIFLRQIDIADDIPLTILTVAMIIAVGRVYNFPLDVSAALALLFCFAGFYMGTKGAEIIALINNGLLIPYANIICTVIVTEILGWTTALITRKHGSKNIE